MKILTIIPIAKGIPRDQLSYFSAKPVPVGTLVTVPFGNRSIKGVVVDQSEVRDLKGSIKSNNFALRNVTTVHTDQGLPSSIFQAGQSTAHFFAQRIGAVLETMIPHYVFDYYATHTVPQPTSTRLHTDIRGIQVCYTERISLYKTIVRENLGKAASTLIIVPSVIQAEMLYSALKSGIEEVLFVAHGRKTKKQLMSITDTVLESSSPIVLIATAPYTSIVRPDWDTFIIEAAGSPHYHYGFGPIFDMRHFIESMAKHSGVRLIYADTLLDTSIRMRCDLREITDLRTTWHITKPERFTIVDMRNDLRNGPVAKASVRIIDLATQKMISEALSQKTGALLLTTRKGLSPLTTCTDCGTSVTCPICQAPLVLHRKSSTSAEARVYICHHCLHTTLPQDRCASCGSWKLSLFGISTESIADEIRSQFPNTPIHIIDGDSTTTSLAISKIIKQWVNDAGSVLVATPMIIPYLEKISYGAIVSMDSLLSIPSYTGSETALHTVLSFLERIKVSAIIQTRNLSHDVIQTLHNESLFEFMKTEIDSRRQFGYPPANVLLKVSLEIPKEDARAATEYFEKIFLVWNPDILAKRSRNAGFIIIQAIIKAEISVWNDDESVLRSVIRELASECKVEVNPESVL